LIPPILHTTDLSKELKVELYPEVGNYKSTVDPAAISILGINENLYVAISPSFLGNISNDPTYTAGGADL